MVTFLSQLRSIRIQPFGLLLFFCASLAVRALMARALLPLGIYDEPLLLTNAQMMADGRVPSRIAISTRTILLAFFSSYAS